MILRQWRQDGLDVTYGDATDPELIATLPLADARWAVSAVPEHPTGVTHEDGRVGMVNALRSAGFSGRIAATAHGSADAENLSARGVDLVLEPFRDAADQAAQLLFEDAATEPDTNSSPEPETAQETV